jgi:ComEC/Rec2-related protein
MSYKPYGKGEGSVPPPFKLRSTIFSRQPLLFWAAALAAGSVIGYGLRQEGLGLTPLFFLTAALAAAAWLLHRMNRGGWAALLSSGAFFAAGVLAVSLALPAWYGWWGENTGYTWVSGVVSARRHGQKADTLVLTSLTVLDGAWQRPLDGSLALTAADGQEDDGEREETPQPKSMPEGSWRQAASCSQLRVGDRILVAGIKLKLPDEPGFPGSFNQRLYWASEGVRFTGYATEQQIWLQPGSGLGRALDSFRLWLYSRMQADMGDEGAGLAAALLMGWTADLSEQRDAYANLGISHVLSVSGLHVSLLMAAVDWLARRRRWMRMQRYMGQGLLIVAYFLLAGVRPSFNRVLFMALLGFAAECCGRESDPVNTLAAAFLLQSILSPLSVFTSACQLTYLATLALLLLRELVPRQKVWGTVVLAMLIAWVVLPFAGAQGYPLATGIANALLVPGYSVLVGASFLYLAVSPLAWIRLLYGGMIGRVARGLGRIVGWAGGALPMLRVPLVGGWGFCAASSALVLLASPRLLGKKRWMRWGCLSTAGAMLLLCAALSGAAQRPQVAVLGSGLDTALYVQDRGETALICRDALYGAEQAAQASYRGYTDTLIYTGDSMTKLEEAVHNQGGVNRVIVRAAYAETIPGWLTALARRYCFELVALEDGQPMAIGSFTFAFRQEGGLELMRGQWRVTYGGVAEEGGTHVVDRATAGGLRKAQSAALAIYSNPYASQGLDEPVVNGYNNSRQGAWVKAWPPG